MKKKENQNMYKLIEDSIKSDSIDLIKYNLLLIRDLIDLNEKKEHVNRSYLTCEEKKRILCLMNECKSLHEIHLETKRSKSTLHNFMKKTWRIYLECQKRRECMTTKNLEKNGSIEKTKDYSQFKFSEDNREIDYNHVNRLVVSLEKYEDNNLKPIIVKSDMTIIDGQHRFKACEILDIPVFYQIDDNYNQMKIVDFNTIQKSWSTKDYLNFWIKNDRIDYKKLDIFCKDTGFSTGIMLRWVSNGGNKYKDFRLGSFKFHIDEKTLKGIINTKKLIDVLKKKNTKPLVIFQQASFHDACRQFFTNQVVDSEKFFDKFDGVPYTIRYSQGSHSYIDQFVEIYNYNSRKFKLSVESIGNRRVIK